jgi:hypothetical protein
LATVIRPKEGLRLFANFKCPMLNLIGLEL